MKVITNILLALPNGEVDGRFGESVNFNGDGSHLAVGALELDITPNSIIILKWDPLTYLKEQLKLL